MGYTTDFSGVVRVDPPFSKEEADFLRRFSESRRMDREKGPYHIGGGDFGQDREADIRDYNKPPVGQPGLWCQWVPTEDGAGLEWNGFEKFYDGAEWMAYLISHFAGARPAAKARFPEKFGFLKGHSVNGTIYAAGEDGGDNWRMDVVDGRVTVSAASIPELEERMERASEEDDYDSYPDVGERLAAMESEKGVSWGDGVSVPEFAEEESDLAGLVRTHYDRGEIDRAAGRPAVRTARKRTGAGSV